MRVSDIRRTTQYTACGLYAISFTPIGYAERTMVPHPNLVRHWQAVAAIVVGAASCTALIVYRRRRYIPSKDELELRRRERLTTTGRLIDGSIIGAEPSELAPETILYQYRIAGVTYECAQDVSTLAPYVQDLRVDFPVQVRYDRANPGDSIVVAESWNGLWNGVWTGGPGSSAPQPSRSESRLDR